MRGPARHATPTAGVRFTAVGCTVRGLFDVAVEDCILAGARGVDAADLGFPGVVDQLHRMDYRRNPAKLRHDLRARQ